MGCSISRKICATRIEFSGYDPYAHIAEKNLKIMGTIDSRRIDRPGIIRMLRNREVQQMWDQVVTHEFPMSQAEEAFKISASQQCGKILLYPHRH